MADVGITRINITDPVEGRGARRFEDAKKHWPAANALYREIFAKLRMPLMPGEETKDCTRKSLWQVMIPSLVSTYFSDS